MAHPGAGNDESEYLRKFCVKLQDIEQLASEEDLLTDVRSIAAGLREGADLDGLQEAFSALLLRLGVAGGLDGLVRGAGIGGLPPIAAHPVEVAHLCPQGRCDRVVLEREAGADRHCALFDEPLRSVQISL